MFRWILDEAGTAGALSPAAVFIDGTHIKANANLNKKIKREVPAAKRYRDELMAEINADREAHGKKPFDDGDEPPKSDGKKRDNTSKKKLARRKRAGFKTVTKSTTDPNCGVFVKGKHQRQFAYEAHTACDKHGYVLERRSSKRPLCSVRLPLQNRRLTVRICSMTACIKTMLIS